MSKKNRRTRWTEQMNKDILDCKIKALAIISENCPINNNGRKKGYVQIMKELWDGLGYGNLGLTGQNLRDQASRLEKMERYCISETTQGILENSESHSESFNELEYATTHPRPLADLHTTSSQFPEDFIENIDNTSSRIKPNLPAFDVWPSHIAEKRWGSINYDQFNKDVNAIYDEIIHFRRNIFNVPSGKAGKNFVAELTFWLKQFNSNSDLNSVALKAFMVLPTLILQKPSATSKSKQHYAAMERRLSLWKNGELSMLMKEIRFIQGKFKASKSRSSVQDVSKIFAKLMMQGKITAAIKLLDKESASGLLTLTPQVLDELRSKHPPPAEIMDECLLYGPIDCVPPGIFDSIDEQMIFNSAMRTRGSAGPSGMDAELYRRVLCSKSFANEGRLLREEIATMTRNLLKVSYEPSLLEGYTSCRLIPLDKDPGVRPIGVGEVLRRIIGKTISTFFKDTIKEAAGPLQVCAGFPAGAEAATHAMSEIFREDETDGILLVDATNAFNTMNRSVALHNIQITCQEISLYLINTYRHSSRLFITGGEEILSQEGTTQGDPLAMPWYAINTSIMINNLRSNIPAVKQVWFADDSAGAGQLLSLFEWFMLLSMEGSKYGYYVNGSKSWLIVRDVESYTGAEEIFGSAVNITTEGKRHLGAAIGSKTFKDEYCEQKVDKWKDELDLLSTIAKSYPHQAYAAYVKGYKSKFTFYMRTIESFEDYVDPILDVLNDCFLPSLFGLDQPIPENLQEVITLTPAQGGLGITNLKEEAPKQFTASKAISSPHIQAIREQEKSLPACNNDIKKQQRSIKAASQQSKMDRIDLSLHPDLRRQVLQARDKGASSWLNALPIKEQGLALNKQEFRDSLCIRYNLPVSDLPSHCTCGAAFSINHALSCKKGGFIAQRHDGIRNLLTGLLSKVCKDVEAEPHLLPLDGETFDLKSASTDQEARLDIKAGSFWSKGLTAFFDVRVTHVNSASNKDKTTENIFREHEMEKKRKYQERILQVEMGSFTPLVFGTNGSKECEIFIKHLATKTSEKSGEDYASCISWIRARLSFELIRSTHRCVRGSRTPFRSKELFSDDFKLNVLSADL